MIYFLGFVGKSIIFYSHVISGGEEMHSFWFRDESSSKLGAGKVPTGALFLIKVVNSSEFWSTNPRFNT